MTVKIINIIIKDLRSKERIKADMFQLLRIQGKRNSTKDWTLILNMSSIGVIMDTTKIEMIFISKKIIEMRLEKIKSLKKIGKRKSTTKKNMEKNYKEEGKEWMITKSKKRKIKRNIITIWSIEIVMKMILPKAKMKDKLLKNREKILKRT